MNLLEKWFFSIFLMWSKKRDYSDFTGIISLMTFGLAIWLNIGTIIIVAYAFGIEFPTSNLFDNRINIIAIVVSWFLILALLFLRKNQILKYRAMIDELSDSDNSRLTDFGLIYSVGSVLIGFITAFTVNNIIN